MNESFTPQGWEKEAQQLSTKGAAILSPLHTDLSQAFPSYDGIVYFAVDTWHKNNASAVVAILPETNDPKRFDFYEQSIAKHRVDLSASALGVALQMPEPTLLQSRMYPEAHLTWTRRITLNGVVVGGLQIAFNTAYGELPSDTHEIDRLWRLHADAVQNVATMFQHFGEKAGSVGDAMKLLAPATPNAYILSWDVDESSKLATSHYGALRNYLLSMKQGCRERVGSMDVHIHDVGDGQDITLWLPDGIDRSNHESVRSFGRDTVLPLLEQLQNQCIALSTHPDSDIHPQVHFAIGLGYVEHDRLDERTSQEYWNIGQLHEHDSPTTVSLTAAAQKVLGSL